MSDWRYLVDTFNLKLRPIERWPQKPTPDRERGPFTATLTNTVKMLQRELWHLGAKAPVLQISLRERDFRLDGMPRADARPEHPGVILSFESKHGPLSLPCDTFTDWKHNLRAIAMHLEHLRHSQLYGVGRYGEVYKGWKQLPAGNGSPSDAQSAAEFLARFSVYNADTILTDRGAFADARRKSLAATHPDSGAGSHELFLAAQQAVKLVEARF